MTYINIDHTQHFLERAGFRVTEVLSVKGDMSHLEGTAKLNGRKERFHIYGRQNGVFVDAANKIAKAK